MKELSIVVVNYHTDDLVKKLRRSIRLKKEWEFIVIDNSENNRGFSKGCNIGAKRAEGRYLLFLNPDCVVVGRAIENMVKFMKGSKSAGIVGPQLLDNHKKAYLSYSKLPTKVSGLVVFSFLDRLWSGNPFSKEHWYKGKSLNKQRNVGSVSGACLMIRRDDFESLSGFDEQMFMYWEDYDLCIRMNEIGKKVVYYPESKIVHLRGGATAEESTETRSWFRKSRFRFMQKHFGWWYALILESWLVITEEWKFVLIVAMAAFLRLYKIFDLMPLIGDQGRDMLAALEGLRENKLPLLGIPSSVPRFKQGPLYIWLLMAIFASFGHKPEYAALVAAVFGLLAVGLLYLMAERWWGRKEAVLSSLILATAPLAVVQSRLAFHTNPIPLVSLWYLWMLVKKLRNKVDYVLLGLSFGILFQFELAVFPLIVLLLMKIWLSKSVGRLRLVMWAMMGVMVAMLPQLIWDVTHGFRQVGLFMVWVGYRMLSFAGYDAEHMVSEEKVAGYIDAMGVYAMRFVSPASYWGVILVGLIMFFGLVLVFKNRKTTFNKPIYWVYSWIVIVVLGFFIHGSPSEAYFPVLFAPVCLTVGYAVMRLKPIYRLISIGLIALMVIVNVMYLVRVDFLMNTPKSAEEGLRVGYGLPFKTQNEIVELIKARAGDQPIALYAYGPGSEHESFVDNYKFLLMVKGVRVVDKQGVPIVFLFGQKAHKLTLLNSFRYRYGGVEILIPY